MEAKIRHLEMIQGAVNRSADNSLKGFAILLLAGWRFCLMTGQTQVLYLYPWLLFYVFLQ
ncbi:MAG: hypothetical protein F4Y44_00995 [Chloroflexi bacterium]|nr:hypothetical protein [Chloroflexota bacterium]